MFHHPCTLIIVTINSGKYNQTPRVAPLRAVHTDACDSLVLHSQCLRSQHWGLGAACARASDGRARWRLRPPARGRAVRAQEGAHRQRGRPGELPPAGSWRGTVRATLTECFTGNVRRPLVWGRSVYTDAPDSPISSPRPPCLLCPPAARSDTFTVRHNLQVLLITKASALQKKSGQNEVTWSEQDVEEVFLHQTPALRGRQKILWPCVRDTTECGPRGGGHAEPETSSVSPKCPSVQLWLDR